MKIDDDHTMLKQDINKINVGTLRIKFLNIQTDTKTPQTALSPSTLHTLQNSGNQTAEQSGILAQIFIVKHHITILVNPSLL